MYSFIGGHYAGINGSLANAFVINAAAIVFHFDVDVIATMIRTDRDLPLVRLARIVPIVSTLDSMRYGIAHQVQEWISDLLDYVVVEFCLGACKREFDLFIGSL